MPRTRMITQGAAIEPLEPRRHLTATLFKDIEQISASSLPEEMLTVGSVTYFVADDGLHGHELWKTDGTAAGTMLVKDIWPGAAAIPSNAPGPRGLTAIGSTVYFYADDGTGYELWKSDGTAAGTVRVKDVNPTGTAWSTGLPKAIENLNGVLIFGAADTTTGYEVWRSDGTEAGTYRISNITPTATNAIKSDFFVHNGIAYFAAETASAGVELWRTDGTAAGTFLVRDIYPGTISSVPGQFTVFNNQVYFSAMVGWSEEIWRTNGTTAGTQMFHGMDVGQMTSYLGRLYVAGEGDTGHKLHYFTTTGGPYTTSTSWGTSARNFIEMGGKLYYSAGNTTGGWDLWVTDGTSAGTKMIKTIQTGSGGVLNNPPATANGLLYFEAVDPIVGDELWRSDGTAAGTYVVRDIAANDSSSPTLITPLGSRVLFAASNSTYGREIWSSDGSNGGTTLVLDVNRKSSGSWPMGFAGTNSTYFSARTALGRELWRTDGTPAGTGLVMDLVNGSGSSYPAGMVQGGGYTFFTAEGGQGRGLWRTDGTSWNTIRLAEAARDEIVIFNGMAYFVGYNSATGAELWKSDGTPAGTQMVKDIRVGAESGWPAYLTVMGDAIYFRATDGSESGLWRSDGTAEGTYKLSFWAPREPMYVLDNKLYYNGGRLIKSDGTAAGTDFVHTVGLVAPQIRETNLSLVGDRFYFAGGEWNELDPWVSDGTKEGTYRLRDLPVGRDLISVPALFTGVGGKVYFTAGDLKEDVELYVSDGTSEGTVQMPGILSGGCALPMELTSYDGALVFAATGPQGRELWTVDDLGLRLMQEIRPGTAGSDPQEFARSGSGLLFSADDGYHGAEIWQLTDTRSPTVSLAGISARNGHAIRLQFSEDVSQSLSTADLSVTHLQTGQVITPTSMSLEYSGSNHLATIRFPGMGRWLANGGYRLTLSATAVKDASGKSLNSGLDVQFVAVRGDGSDETIRVARSVDGKGLEITGSGGGATPLYSGPAGSIAAINVSGGGGRDQMILDLSNGDPIAGMIVDIASGDGGDEGDLMILRGSSAAERVRVDGSGLRVGTSRVNLTGFSEVRVESGGGDDELTVNDDLRLVEVRNSAGADKVLVEWKGRLISRTPQYLGSLFVTDSGLATLARNSGALRVGDVGVYLRGVLDIGNSEVRLQVGEGERTMHLERVQNMVSRAYSKGTWTGTGIKSTDAANDLSKKTGVAVVPADDGVVVKYTWNGDANGDGQLDIDDYVRIDSGFLAKLVGYSNGDFNFDNVINLADYWLIDRAYPGQDGVF